MDERLNGLLDGELSPAEASDTARALRDDPSLAVRLAELARLRALTAAIDANLPMPSIPGEPARRLWRRPALVGGTLVALSLAAIGLVLLPARETPSLAAHRRFLAATMDTASAASSLPDLSAAGLRLNWIEPAGGGTYAGYVGPRGCRLGLWLGPRAGAPTTGKDGWRTETVEKADGQVVWIATTLSMDAGRFAALAGVVRSGSAAGATLLAEAAAHSACLS